MAFVVETGAVVEGANAYVSVAYADAYHSDRGNSLWTGTDAEKQAAIIRATWYIDTHYMGRWKGYRTGTALQILHWPRQWVLYEDVYPGSVQYIDPHTMPQQLKDATCEAALRALTGELLPDLKRGGQIIREKLDVIETEYAPNASTVTRFQIVDHLLSSLILPIGSNEAVRG